MILATAHAIAAAYVLTFLIVTSDVAGPIRRFIISHTPGLSVDGTHVLSCRMCAGFWVSMAVAYLTGADFFITYGLSYFLATQERIS